MMELAPILLFVYNRPKHVERGLASLLQNAEAGSSELYVFSDAARTEAEEEAVREVRNIVHATTGFKQIHVIERTENWGLARNVIGGVSTIVNQYGRVIVLEDDLVVSPYFLQFMNTSRHAISRKTRRSPPPFSSNGREAGGGPPGNGHGHTSIPTAAHCCERWRKGNSQDALTSTELMASRACCAGRLPERTTLGPSAGTPRSS